MPYSKDYRPALVALGTTLAKARQSLKRSQGDVAYALRMSQASLSHIERGAETRLSTFVDIAREVGLEPVLVPKKAVHIALEITADFQRAAEIEREREARQK